MDEKELLELEKKVEEMKEMQLEIDRKTKDAAAYKKSNEWLVSIIKCSVISLAVFLSVLVAIMGWLSCMLLLSILIMSKVLPENILRKQILLNLVTMGLCSIKANGNTNSVDRR